MRKVAKEMTVQLKAMDPKNKKPSVIKQKRTKKEIRTDKKGAQNLERSNVSPKIGETTSVHSMRTSSGEKRIEISRVGHNFELRPLQYSLRADHQAKETDKILVPDSPSKRKFHTQMLLQLMSRPNGPGDYEGMLGRRSHEQYRHLNPNQNIATAAWQFKEYNNFVVGQVPAAYGMPMNYLQTCKQSIAPKKLRDYPGNTLQLDRPHRTNVALSKFADSLLSPKDSINPGTRQSISANIQQNQMLLSSMQQHFDTPDQDHQVDDLAQIANYFNLPSPTGVPIISPLAESFKMNSNGNFSFDNIEEGPHGLNYMPEQSILQSSKDVVPQVELSQDYKPNTNTNKNSLSTKTIESDSKSCKRKGHSLKVDTSGRTASKVQKKAPYINVDQINKESPGSTKNMGNVVKISSFIV